MGLLWLRQFFTSQLNLYCKRSADEILGQLRLAIIVVGGGHCPCSNFGGVATCLEKVNRTAGLIPV